MLSPEQIDQAGSYSLTMMRSEQINELATALAKAQGAMENAPMNRINPHFKSKYADLASVLNSTREPLSINGLAVTQQTLIREGGMVLRTVLLHSSGQWIASEYLLPATARPQEMGSALTYARRYSYAAMVCNSSDEDDDGEAAENGKHRVFINTEQLDKLKDLIAKSEANEELFCAFCQIGKLEELPANRFDAAVAKLNQKILKANANKARADAAGN